MARRGDLPANLRLLCARHRSISEVCRRLGVNRQQFNKYLSGAARPSAHNLNKLCDFFAVDEATLLLPAERFKVHVEARGAPAARSLAGLLGRAFPPPGRELRRYLGYYHSHFHSLGWPGMIMRSLVRLHEVEGRVVSKAIERARDPKGGDRFVYKYDGLATLAGDRLFIVEYESLLGGAVTNTILYPTYRSRVRRLHGLTFGVSGGPGLDPACSRVVYDYLGPTVERRAALRACGLFAPDTTAIDPAIKGRIANAIAPGEAVFRGVP